MRVIYYPLIIIFYYITLNYIARIIWKHAVLLSWCIQKFRKTQEFQISCYLQDLKISGPYLYIIWTCVIFIKIPFSLVYDGGGYIFLCWSNFSFRRFDLIVTYMYPFTSIKFNQDDKMSFFTFLIFWYILRYRKCTPKMDFN